MEHLTDTTTAIGRWLSVPGGSWQPNAQEVSEARSQLKPYVVQQARMAGEVLPTWSSYTFQYQGQEIHGKKVVFINAFCGTPPPHATTEMVIVFDGGPSYFIAYWDPADNIYISIRFNGHA